MQITGTIVLENVGVWPLAVTSLVVLTAVLLWFYPRQILDVGPVGWLLPVLRWCGFSMLAVMLLRPVLTQTAEKVATGQVIAIVDTSRSMDLVDSARTPAERVSLARAFDLLPAGTDPSATHLLSRIHELDTFAQNVIRAQNDLEYARLVGRGVEQKQAALHERTNEYVSAAQSLIDEPTMAALDGLSAVRMGPPSDARTEWNTLELKIRDLESRAAKIQTTADETLYLSDPAVQKICDDLASQSRLALALKALRIDRKALSSEASDLRSFSLGKDLSPLEIDPRGSGQSAPTVHTTASLVDVPAGLGAAETLASELPARAIILLTDGHRGGHQSDLSSSVRPSGVPVYPINVAASHISDAWISGISLANTEVFRGQSVEGQVEVQFQGNVATPTLLTVRGRAASAPVALRPRVGPDGRPMPNVLIGRFSIVISPPPGEVDELLRFSVASEAGEATTENNTARRWIKVFSNKVRVTFVSSGPTWDVANLQHLLQRMPWIEVNTITLASPDAQLKLSPAQLVQDDILILHDIPVRALDASQWDAVGRMVADRGGSAIVIAGTSASLADYATQPLAAELLPFHDLHPVWRQWPGDTAAFHFSPTPLGLATALNVGEPAETAQRWAETPSLFRYLQLPSKNLFSDVRRWLAESDSAAPVITERDRGNGHLLFIGLDEMWRWGARNSEPFDQRIWQQMIHYATGERSAVSTPDVAFDVEHISIDPGGSTRVRAWIRNAPALAKTVTVEVQARGAPASSVVLTRGANARFEGAFTSSQPGDYLLRLRSPGRGGRARTGDANVLAVLPLHVVSDDALGFINLATDPAILDRIARASGGRPLTIDQINELPRVLKEVRVEDSQLARKPIYSSPLLMVFVMACLSAEWALRKRAGLS